MKSVVGGDRPCTWPNSYIKSLVLLYGVGISMLYRVKIDLFKPLGLGFYDVFVLYI